MDRNPKNGRSRSRSRNRYERTERKNMGWKCLSCGFPSNFLSKTECFKCSEAKGDAVNYEMPARGE